LRHATFLAIAKLSGQYHPHGDAAMSIKACDWTGAWGNDGFDYGAATRLLSGDAVRMPTCPACAVFVDMALESR